MSRLFSGAATVTFGQSDSSVIGTSVAPSNLEVEVVIPFKVPKMTPAPDLAGSHHSKEPSERPWVRAQPWAKNKKGRSLPPKDPRSTLRLEMNRVKKMAKELSNFNEKRLDAFKVGAYVSRNGSDVHRIVDISEDKFHGQFECVAIDPGLTWERGEVEGNLVRRYEILEEADALEMIVVERDAMAISDLDFCLAVEAGHVYLVLCLSPAWFWKLTSADQRDLIELRLTDRKFFLMEAGERLLFDHRAKLARDAAVDIMAMLESAF